MSFRAVWSDRATGEYQALEAAAEIAFKGRGDGKIGKATKAEGLFKQTLNCIEKLLANPRHPGLKTHKFDSLTHPYDRGQPVFEAYVQNQTPGAYRVFWCYVRAKGKLR